MAQKDTDVENYKIGVVCSNCEYHGPVAIHKGMLVKDTPCPQCGNKTLRTALPGEV